MKLRDKILDREVSAMDMLWMRTFARKDPVDPVNISGHKLRRVHAVLVQLKVSWQGNNVYVFGNVFH
jgi:hypothetical protein